MPVPTSMTLLTTKLYIPRTRPNLVLCPRLTARLNGALTGPFTLISAPAGFECHAHFEEAVQHSLQAGDPEPSARLIASLAPDLMKHDDFVTLRRWLARLPDSVIWAHPRLCLTQVWMLLDINQPETAARYLTKIHELLANAHPSTLLAEAMTLRAVAEAKADHPDRALALAQ